MNIKRNVAILEAPQIVSKEEIHKYSVRIFLAGGISNCPQWQEEAIDLIVHSRDWKPYQLLIFNPRCANFDVNAGATAIQNQVTWEWERLNGDLNLYWFWFPKETMCPITLFELGRATQDPDDCPIIVGAEPDYPRRTTLRQQLKLARPELNIANDLEALVAEMLRLIT